MWGWFHMFWCNCHRFVFDRTFILILRIGFFLHHVAMPFRFTQGSFFSPCFTLIKWVYRFCNFTFKKAITYFSSLLAVSRNFGSKLLCMHSYLTCTSGTQIPFQFRGRNNLLKLQSILDSAILLAFNFFKKIYWTNYN